MQSLLADLDDSTVDAFLTAVDEVMNSNTFLLKARAEVPITADNRVEILTRFLHDHSFQDMMLAVDRARDWWNLQDRWDFPDPILAASPTNVGTLVHQGMTLDVQELTEAAFTARLRWMLQESFSPYSRHLDSERTDAVLEPFFDWLFSPNGRPLPRSEAQRQWTQLGWSFCAVRPDFLHCTGYYTDQPCSDLAYFDGGDSDTATFFYRNDVFFLLLTNGSP